MSMTSGLYHLNCTHTTVPRGFRLGARCAVVHPPQAARDDVRKPLGTALRVAFPAPSGRREGLTMGRHRQRLPSYRGNGKEDYNEC